MPTVPLSLPARGFRRMRLSSTAFETALVRASVGALGAERNGCRHCHRTPLVGECVHVYSSSKRGEELVCELCRPLRTAAPDRTVRVRSAEAVPLVRPLASRP